MSSSNAQRIGRFEVIRRLGRGSQGSVYLGKDPNLERYVAIKVLQPDRPELASTIHDGASLEGRISSRLHHPNIVSIYEASELNGVPYLVFEFVQGQTLRDLLKGGGMALESAVALMGPILEGIAYAHAQGVIHLDLSPRNILVDREGVPRIMDFGLSKLVGTPRKGEANVIGTLRYMAPEHFSDDDLGPYTDVFALAGTFYELVRGSPVMNGDSASAIVRQVTHKPVDFAALCQDAAGKAFARFLQGGFEKDYRARYCDGAAMKEAFGTFLREANLEGSAGASTHSTVEFLLRRMQRKQDFPTISRTLVDINRLTSKGSAANAEKLANVILKDFALTSKLLKLVNSAFYSGIAGEVKHISRAVVLLGFERVRMTANSLTFFSHMQGSTSSVELKDSMVKSFMSGLIARHLAQRAKLPDAEEAFICGLFQNLGENLAIYYFPDEHDEVKQLMVSRSLGKASASRGILGVSYAELGAAVARTWKLPDSIIETILGGPDDQAATLTTPGEHFRAMATFANELCEIASWRDLPGQNEALRGLVQRLGSNLLVTEVFALRLLAAGLEKLTQYSEVFEISPSQSAFCKSVRAWIDSRRDETSKDSSDAASSRAAG
jgi:eukaryotic-like serine/threonine-protein kinase